MELNESIAIFEKYFDGELNKTPELLGSNENPYVELFIDNNKVLIHRHFMYIESLNSYFDIEYNDGKSDLESLLSNAAQVLKDILTGNPTKKTRVNLALNKVKDLIGNDFITSISRSDLTEGLLVIDCFHEKEVNIEKLKLLKNRYRNNLFNDSLNSNEYLFSIKITIL